MHGLAVGHLPVAVGCCWGGSWVASAVRTWVSALVSALGARHLDVARVTWVFLFAGRGPAGWWWCGGRPGAGGGGDCGRARGARGWWLVVLGVRPLGPLVGCDAELCCAAVCPMFVS